MKLRMRSWESVPCCGCFFFVAMVKPALEDAKGLLKLSRDFQRLLTVDDGEMSPVPSHTERRLRV